ncbi:DNA repair helicase, putative [Plasmodium gaboni]|uniref:DNA repair helicase, putative n=1 Tax=Plasmodium gaboni TaxID=647221 RepID=A0ABY1UUC2_9APIC|nr:DNA repair helicase, putative [Plasmodium gaboni]
MIEQKIHKRYKIVKKDDVNHRYTINDIEVYFPYELYDCQYNYMLSVLSALKKRENAILESPTGTGKTLCLLCASISYVVDILEKKGHFNENINISENNKNISLEFGKNSESVQKKVVVNEFPKIIYASRTHSQLKQVIKELKNVYFIKNNEKYKLLTTILGSRDQLCVHNINYNYKGTLLNNMCKRTRKNGECIYHNGLKYLYKLKHLFTTPMDVETLSEIGKGNSVGQNIHFCPFYATREIQNECHIILLPYNYLFEESTRKILKLNLENSIIIIDEGHNIENVAEDAVSFKLKDTDLNLFLEALKATLTILEKVNEIDKEIKDKINIDELFILNRSINALITWLTNLHLEKNEKKKIKEKHKIYQGKQIFEIFEKNSINITKDNFDNFNNLLSAMIELLNKYTNDFKLSQMDVKNINRFIASIDHVKKAFGILFSDIVKNCIEYFNLYINEEKINNTDTFNNYNNNNNNNSVGGNVESMNFINSGKYYDGMNRFIKKKIAYDNNNNDIFGSNNIYSNTPSNTLNNNNNNNNNNSGVCKTISLLCFSATASLCGIIKEKINSIIVTSGTLSPIEPFSKQLSGNYFSFKHILENDHVIKSHQLFVGCMTHYNNQILLSTYENRANENYIRSLGNCIFDIIVCIPYGVLIFFSSYSSMTETVNSWKRMKIYDKINTYKTIFVEPNKATDLKDILDQYEILIKKKRKGAILMGVCRGKISEGIDFKDDCCRGVIICGLPYGNVYDSKIIFKKEFLDNFKYNKIEEGSNSSNITSNNNISKGNKWYNEEAMRSINQSIGRVIRHKNDYGAIFFLDSRFSNNQRIKEISKWVRTHFRIYRDVEQIQSDIDKFFELFKGLNDRLQLESDQNKNQTSNKTKLMNNYNDNMYDINNSNTISEGGFTIKDNNQSIDNVNNNSSTKLIGKNFQDCFIKSDKNKKSNKHDMPQNKFSFNPSKKMKNQPKILSMIQNITKGKNPEKKSIYIDNKNENDIDTQNNNNNNNIFKNKEQSDVNSKCSSLKLDNAKLLIASFREILSKDIYDKFFELIKETKKKSNEKKYEILINNILELITQNFIKGNKEIKNYNISDEKQKHILFNDIMNDQELIDIWKLLIKLINNFFPVQEKEKCFFILQKRFKERTTDFDELEKYVYNYRLEKIEII